MLQLVKYKITSIGKSKSKGKGKCKGKGKGKGKGKILPRTGHKGPEGEKMCKLYSFFNLGFRLGWVFNATLRPLYPRKGPGSQCTGGWVGPRAGLDRCGKSRSHMDFDPLTVQPVASRYTD
jgi:hypothetical protein